MVIPVVFFIVSNLVTRHFAGKFNVEILLRLGLVVAAIGIAGIAGLIFSSAQGPLRLVLAFSVTTFGLGPVFAIAPMRALDTTDSPTGVASAMLNTIPMLMGGLAAISLSVFHDGSSRPLAFTILGLLCVAGISYWIASHRTGRSIPRT